MNIINFEFFDSLAIICVFVVEQRREDKEMKRSSFRRLLNALFLCQMYFGALNVATDVHHSYNNEYNSDRMQCELSN